MKTCVNCGAQMDDQYQVCHNCGAQQPTAYQTPPTAQQPYGQPMYQQPYGQPMYQQPRNPRDGKGLSIAALVLGICGVVFCWVGGLNYLILACSILGIVFGYLGRKKSIAAYGRASGIATAGFILGIIGTAICGIGVISCTACACAIDNAYNSLFY